MIDKICTYVLIALVMTGSLVAAFAPDVFAEDAGTAAVAPAVEPAPAAVAEPPVEAATAAPVASGEPTVSGVVSAFRGGQWLAALAGVIFLLVTLVRRLWDPASKTGKRALAIAVSVAVTGAAAVYFGAPITVSLGITVLLAAWTASGINEDLKDVTRRS